MIKLAFFSNLLIFASQAAMLNQAQQTAKDLTQTTYSQVEN